MATMLEIKFAAVLLATKHFSFNLHSSLFRNPSDVRISSLKLVLVKIAWVNISCIPVLLVPSVGKDTKHSECLNGDRSLLERERSG